MCRLWSKHNSPTREQVWNIRWKDVQVWKDAQQVAEQDMILEITHGQIQSSISWKCFFIVCSNLLCCFNSTGVVNFTSATQNWSMKASSSITLDCFMHCMAGRLNFFACCSLPCALIYCAVLTNITQTLFHYRSAITLCRFLDHHVMQAFNFLSDVVPTGNYQARAHIRQRNDFATRI